MITSVAATSLPAESSITTSCADRRRVVEVDRVAAGLRGDVGLGVGELRRSGRLELDGRAAAAVAPPLVSVAVVSAAVLDVSAAVLESSLLPQAASAERQREDGEGDRARALEIA